jgi:hypothetical protein
MDEHTLPPKASVLIVSRNCESALRRTLASLAPVAAPRPAAAAPEPKPPAKGGKAAAPPAPPPEGPVEVIVVDNGSSDGSSGIDGDFPWVVMLRMPKDFGWTKAVNVGTRTAAGEFLCLCPPGVEFQPGTIPELVQVLESAPQALAVAPLTVDGQGTPVTRLYPLPQREVLAAFWRTGSLGRPQPIDTAAASIEAEHLVNSPLLLRRQSIVGMNYLDERYGHFWSDAEISTQIKRAGRKLLLLPQITVKGLPVFQPIPERLDKRGAQLSADAALGAAAYLGKHYGFGPRLTFHLSAAILSFFAIFSFRSFGGQLIRFINIFSGAKIDGNQG